MGENGKDAADLTRGQSLTVGVALFSMFFGAGNLILPPLLGLQAGTSTPAAMAGFLITAIGLPIVGIVAVGLAGTARELAARVHPRFSRIFVAAVYLAIGPCLAIPRTSSTAFEMLAPLLPEGAPVGAARLVFSVVFFAVAYGLAMHPGKVTGLLGRITGPALIALIVAVVGAAVVAPSGAVSGPQEAYQANALVTGALNGYQSMDVLAALSFGLVISENIRELGVTDDRGLVREIRRAGEVAGALMALIYCGMAWVGASLGSVIPEVANGAAVLTTSATLHFGTAGTVVVALIFLLACLNVCISLVTCCGTYFCETYGADAAGAHGPFAGVPYRYWALAFAAFSCVLSNVGLDAILLFSVPLLGALYPMAIMLVLMGVSHKFCDAHPQTWPWAIGATALVSVCDALRDAVTPALWLPFDALPLASLGLDWILPAVFGLIVGYLRSRTVGGGAAE